MDDIAETAPPFAPAPAAPEPAPAVHADAIEVWFHDHFNCLPIGWETAMRNHVRAAVDDLKQRLRSTGA